MGANSSLLRLVDPVGSDAYSHVGYPSACHQKLILPREKALARIALKFFSPGVRRLSGIVRAITCRLSGGVQPRRYLATRMLEKMTDSIADGPVAHAISVGTPGPYNKQSILHIIQPECTLLLTKFGCGPAVTRLLDNEAGWLGRLAEVGELAGQVPRLHRIVQADDCAGITQSVAGGKCAGAGLGPAHLAFLEKLQTVRADVQESGDPAMIKNMRSRLSSLSTVLAARHVELFEEAISVLEELFFGQSLPAVAAHRDFVPWNTRYECGRLFVYDWEYASGGYTPTYDAFHYRLMPVVLKRQPGSRDAARLLDYVGRVMSGRPGGKGRAYRIDQQLYGYLADLCLFYLESNGGVIGDDKVVNRYLSLMGRYAEWRQA